MPVYLKAILLISYIFFMLTLDVQAVTDYANKSTDYEGEYKSTHNDITTVGVPEKEPTLEQTQRIQKAKLELQTAPKSEPDPDRMPDRVLLQKIGNGSAYH